MKRPLHRNTGYDIAVIGGGIAGLTAAMHAAGRGFSTTLIEASPLFGGQVATVGAVGGLPTGPAVSGTDLATALVDVVREGAMLVQEPVHTLSAIGEAFDIACESGTVRARRIIVASGQRPRRLEVAGEQQFSGRGVSHCATCDGPFFRGADVVVAGGGDAALQQALTLAGSCRTVFIVSRRKLRARAAYVDRAVKKANIRFVWDVVIDAVLGEDVVRAVLLRNTSSGAVRELACSGVFPLLGGLPNTGFLPVAVPLDANGYVIADEGLRTCVPGVFAIGAVRAGYCGELASAIGEAASVIKIIAG